MVDYTLPMPKPAEIHQLADHVAREESESLNLVFAALADPTRREILTMLAASDCLVSELAEPFDISLQAVSRHVQVLVRAGLVEQERSGRISRCRLDTGPMYTAAVWLNQYTHYWQTQFETLAAWLETLEAQGNAEPKEDS